MVRFPQKDLGKYEVLDRWIAFEKESHFGDFRKIFLPWKAPN
jgi:hypothetical protein